MNPSPNTRRYELLCNALEKLITDPRTSKRVRLTAITRLDDLLRRAERAEAAEQRRAERERQQAAKREEQLLQEHDGEGEQTTSTDDAIERMQGYISAIGHRKNELQKSM